MKNQNPDDLYRQIIIPEEFKGMRLDQVLARLFPEYSRSRIQGWIKSGQAKVNHQSAVNKQKCEGGEQISIVLESEKSVLWTAQKSDIANCIVYEDQDLMIINKPVGMVVHPGAGNSENTIANQLLDYFPALSEIPRAGIVHRLDKNTSGLMIVAKTLKAQTGLVSQLQDRLVHREYVAITIGVLISGGTINASMARHSIDRQKMAVVHSGGKEAVTHYRILERFRAHSLIRVILETGRTHQIRVHLAHKHYPLLGDSVYGARNIIPKYAQEELIQAIKNYKHQALHAKKLSFQHPVSKNQIEIEVPLPDEMERLIVLLRENTQKSN